MSRRLTQANVLAIGWVSLFVGVSIPAAASVAAIRLFWNLPCFAGVQWTFAPLVIGCEPIGDLRTDFGWIATAVCLAAMVTSVGIAATSVARWVRSRSRRDALSSLPFADTVAAVVLITAFVLASNPDGATSSRGAWITLSSLTAFGTAMLFGLTSAVVVLLASARATRVPRARRTPYAISHLTLPLMSTHGRPIRRGGPAAPGGPFRRGSAR